MKAALKLKHFLRPGRSLQVVRERLAQLAETRQLIRQGKQRFAADPRYRIEFVDQGFMPRPQDAADDTVLLQRICRAYSKAIERQQDAGDAYQPNQWWRLVQQGHLGPVRRALANGDLDALGAMYGNFFRDPCGGGLVGLPIIMNQLYSRRDFSPELKHLFLADALYRLDFWNEKTLGKFPVSALRTPDIGNPFGVVTDGTLVRTGAEDQHYYAQKVAGLVGAGDRPVIAEIGGGFGGMAGFLIRDNPGLTYINFDVPETIALASWYLLKAFPQLNATLYGEMELQSALRDADILLMPAFAIGELPEKSLDVLLAAHVLSDLPDPSIREYIAKVVRTTRGAFLHISREDACRTVSDYLTANAPDYALISEEPVDWNRARSLRNDEIEVLYTRRH